MPLPRNGHVHLKLALNNKKKKHINNLRHMQRVTDVIVFLSLTEPNRAVTARQSNVDASDVQMMTRKAHTYYEISMTAVM